MRLPGDMQVEAQDRHSEREDLEQGIRPRPLPERVWWVRGEGREQTRVQH